MYEVKKGILKEYRLVLMHRLKCSNIYGSNRSADILFDVHKKYVNGRTDFMNNNNN